MVKLTPKSLKGSNQNGTREERQSKGKGGKRCSRKDIKKNKQASPKLPVTNHPPGTKLQFNKILETFSREGNKSPKREFFNAFIIRCVGRFCRYLVLGTIPKNTSIKIDRNDTSQCSLWEEGLKLYRYHKEMIEEISKISEILSGQGIDIKNGYQPLPVKSFNNSFCKGFFQNPIAKNVFKLILMIFFTDISSEGLAKRFRFKCCKNPTHDSVCNTKWWNFEKYMKESYLKDLGVEKYNEQDIDETLDQIFIPSTDITGITEIKENRENFDDLVVLV